MTSSVASVIMAERKLPAATLVLGVISTSAAVLAIFFNGLMNPEGRKVLVGTAEQASKYAPAVQEAVAETAAPSTSAAAPVTSPAIISNTASTPAESTITIVEQAPSPMPVATSIAPVSERLVLNEPRPVRRASNGTSYKLNTLPDQVTDSVSLTYESDH